MKLLDLFAGIGGFSLAAHWIGWETIAFCEQDRKCQERLRLRFGHDIPIYDDIKQFPAKLFRGRADILTAGFPCQPFSNAGQRKGTADDRYLWDEVVRVVSETKPAWVCGENVAGIATMVFERGQVEVESRRLTRTAEADDYHSVLSREEHLQLERCCADLEGEGYEVQPLIIPACAVNAPHRRDRVWIIAHAESGRSRGGLAQISETNGEIPDEWHVSAELGDADCEPHSDADESGLERQTRGCETGIRGGHQRHNSEPHSNASGDGRGPGLREARPLGNGHQSGDGGRIDTNASDTRLQGHEFAGFANENWFEAASRFCGVHNDLSNWLDKYRGLNDATETKTITRQNLSDLRNYLQSETVWEKLRGRYTIFEQTDLFTVLCEFEARANESNDIPFACEEIAWNCLRELWDFGVSGRPPQGWQHREQYRGECANALSLMSHEIALATESLVWRFRLETSDANRVDRLKQLGNSVVPVEVYEIFRAIDLAEKEQNNYEKTRSGHGNGRGCGTNGI